ncbi:MAG TPA: hypothetical protein VLN57_13495 [Xanthobacteraceae bacterium]|nr:hypothetical protein [Xanthobacteraceae bacterium]
MAEIGGENVDPLTVWAGLRKRPISKAEFDFRLADQAWLQRARPEDPKVSPRRPVDLATMAPPFAKAAR